MGFEDIAQRMNQRAGGKPGPIDVAAIQRREGRFEAGTIMWGGLFLVAISLGLNAWLAMTGWIYSTGILLTVIGVMMFCGGVKQLWENTRRSSS